MPIDLSKIKAIDVHVHAEVSCHDPEDPVMGQYFDAASAYFKAPRERPKMPEIAEQLETGTVWINEFLHLSPFAPFGGHKQSGFGAEYGIEGLKEFTYTQVITVKKDALV